MANNMDIKILVQNIVNGSFCENLCRICLLPLDALCENIFTKIYKGGNEYCAADILKEVCRIELSDTENFSICSDCFITASSAYKFYLMAHRSQEILQFYIDNIQLYLNTMNISGQVFDSNSVCISLPIFNPETKNFDYDLEGLAMFDYSDDDSVTTHNNEGHLDTENIEMSDEKTLNYKGSVPIKARKVEIKKDKIDLNDVVIVMEENGDTSFFKANIDGTLMQVDESEKQNFKKVFASSSQHDVVLNDDKKRRMRNPMTYKSCSKCPIKYRFVAKLKEHMQKEHNIDLFVCKVCDVTIEGEQEFDKHLEEHTNMHRCTVCNTVFKRQDTIIAHLKKHEEEMKNNIGGGHICEICGQLLQSEDELKEHYEVKHKKKFTCFYCGRMYKGELSFELHVKKHETYMNKNSQKDKKPQGAENAGRSSSKTRYPCTRCERDFVDERALMWHLRLHDNQRPYVCQECGRAFVSLNRRNQHALCAHTAPARRCPLCPALFHLRSMVNTHIKKVHLNSHKRRNRTSKYQDVSWRTETVPIQELSVAIQNDLLELRTSQEFSEVKYET